MYIFVSVWIGYEYWNVFAMIVQSMVKVIITIKDISCKGYISFEINQLSR